MISTFSPSVRWYADEIMSNEPFSLVRFNDILRNGCPGVPCKYVPGHKNLGAEMFRVWAFPKAVQVCRDTVLGTHQHPRYWPAVWHQDNLERRGWLSVIEKWLGEHGLLDLTWHHGGVWQQAVLKGQFHIIVRTLREQSLPIVFVGPERTRPAAERLNADEFITVPPLANHDSIPHIKQSVLAFDYPSVVSFAASIPGKAAIQQLFPMIGHHSYLIDFGSVWDALCGVKERMYQGDLTPERIELNWEGP